MPQDLTQLLVAWSHGDQAALDQLMPIVYDELRRLARSYLRRERPDHSLEGTAVVHEAYLRLVDQRQVEWQSRAQFFGLASQMIRNILVDHARRRNRLKRGGDACKISVAADLAATAEPALDLVELDDALQNLSKLDSRQARIVEMRFFGGLSIEETAEALQISPATVKRDWTIARAWLQRELAPKSQ